MEKSNQDQDIKVSVLCITYNQKDYISDAIDSFLNQKTDFNYEIIINDDASTDGTTEILLEYEKRYPEKIKIITHEENQCAYVQNYHTTFIFPLAKGEFFALCEGDDYWVDEHKLQKQYDAMRANPDATMCVTASIRVQAETKEVLATTLPHKNNMQVPLEDMLCEIHTYDTATYFLSRETFIKYMETGISELKAHGDHKMSTFFAISGPVIYLADITAAYRVRAQESTNRSLYLSKDFFKKTRELEKNRLELLAAIDTVSNGNYREYINRGKENIHYKCLLDTSNKKRLEAEFPDRFAAEPALVKFRVALFNNRPTLVWVTRQILSRFSKS